MLDSEMYFGLFSLAVIPVTIVDVDDPLHPIVFANRAFSDLTGYMNDGILGQNFGFLQSRTANPKTVKAMHHSIHAKQDSFFILGSQKRNGQPFHCFLSLSFFTSPSGKNICLVCQYDTHIGSYPPYVFDEVACFDGNALKLITCCTNSRFTSLLNAQKMASHATKTTFHMTLREAKMRSRLAIAV